MSYLPANYLAIEPLLIARLEAELGAAVQAVGGVIEFEAALDDPESATPAAYVLYAGDAALQNEGGQGTVARATQLWQVALRVRPAIVSGRASMVVAGELMSKVIAALAGWRPPVNGFQPLRRVQDQGRTVFYDDGVALIVMDFDVRVPLSIG